jgi:ABC-type multidrug transport system permease subunit
MQETVTLTSTAINEKIGRLGEYVSPALIEVETKVDSTSSGSQLNFGAAFFPGVLFMALMFMASGMASDVWVEKERGTLRRIVSSPQRLSDFLAGKVLSATLWMMVVSLVALLVGVMGVGVNIATLPLAVVWAAFAGSVFLAVIMLIHLFASSARTAGVLTTMIIFPLLMIGGSFFPFEAMPEGLATIGRMTPNGWALMQFKSIIAGTAEPASLGLAFLGLSIVGALAFFLAIRRMRHGFVSG